MNAVASVLAVSVSVVCDQVDQVVPAHQVDDINEVHELDPVHQVDHKDEYTSPHITSYIISYHISHIISYHDITWVSKVTFFKDSDGLSSFLEKKDFDPSGFCFKSSYQDPVREFSCFSSFWLFLVPWPAAARSLQPHLGVTSTWTPSPLPLVLAVAQLQKNVLIGTIFKDISFLTVIFPW